jgi:hypothetical protein
MAQRLKAISPVNILKCRGHDEFSLPPFVVTKIMKDSCEVRKFEFNDIGCGDNSRICIWFLPTWAMGLCHPAGKRCRWKVRKAKPNKNVGGHVLDVFYSSAINESVCRWRGTFLNAKSVRLQVLLLWLVAQLLFPLRLPRLPPPLRGTCALESSVWWVLPRFVYDMCCWELEEVLPERIVTTALSHPLEYGWNFHIAATNEQSQFRSLCETSTHSKPKDPGCFYSHFDSFWIILNGSTRGNRASWQIESVMSLLKLKPLTMVGSLATSTFLLIDPPF